MVLNHSAGFAGIASRLSENIFFKMPKNSKDVMIGFSNQHVPHTEPHQIHEACAILQEGSESDSHSPQYDLFLDYITSHLNVSPHVILVVANICHFCFGFPN